MAMRTFAGIDCATSSLRDFSRVVASGTASTTRSTVTTKVLNSKDVQDKLAAQGAEAASNTPEQFRALIKDDLVKWAKVVKDSGAQVD